MLATTSSHELTEWLALFEIEADEQRSSQQSSKPEGKPEPVMDSSGIKSAIEQAREREGLR